MLAIQADAGSLSGIKQIVEQTVAKFGKVHIVVPSAGVLPNGDTESTTEEMFDRTYAINVKGPFFLAQQVAPHMPRDGSGRIIFVSTSLCKATLVTPNYLLYNSTKGAIEQMTRVMAKDLGRKEKGSIVVNAIAPGPTATELFLKGKPDSVVNMMASWSPHNRLGQPDDIAEAMMFLAGEGSRWVGGQVLYTNGAFVC